MRTILAGSLEKNATQTPAMTVAAYKGGAVDVGARLEHTGDGLLRGLVVVVLVVDVGVGVAVRGDVAVLRFVSGGCECLLSPVLSRRARGARKDGVVVVVWSGVSVLMV